MTEEPGFDSRQDRFSLHSVETGSGTHQDSYPVDSGDHSPGVKAAGA
jgi:hypothetical protein